MTDNTAGNTVLIIEDEIDIQNFVSRVLELEGYKTRGTTDGSRGMEIIQEHRVSLVVLDLGVPGSDGWSILRRVKRDPALAAIPVIVLTASAGADQRRRTLRLGAASYLVKPVSARLLSQTVREILGHKGRPRRRRASPSSAP
jgi:DNA-binding response OmpR family regulator